MKTNYLMSAEDVANELGVSKGHAYKVATLNKGTQNIV